jgi:hypothetical protein
VGHVLRGPGFLVALLEMSLQDCVGRAVACVCAMVTSPWITSTSVISVISVRFF